MTRNRTKRVVVNLDDAEHSKLHDLAARDDVTMSAWLRRRLRETVTRGEGPEAVDITKREA